jgi:DNA polymerase-3 subunit epsilon
MVDPMPPDELNLAAMADELGKSPDYRVLRRLAPRTEYASSDGHATKTGIMLDVETTGLDTARDEIGELAMVKFTYLPDDRIAQITDIFHRSAEPERIQYPRRLPELTGITDEMVLGIGSIQTRCTFASDAVIVIAHNASFSLQICRGDGEWRAKPRLGDGGGMAQAWI